jgi:hypothetical protein
VHLRTRKQSNPGLRPRVELRQSPTPLPLEGPVPPAAARPKRVLLIVDPMGQFDPRDRDRRVSEST